MSWYDVTEFCKRLSHYTGRNYRLPSEAEWEYACRAGTETPFHFEETITTDLANYNGSDREHGFYAFGPTGDYRRQPTSVGYFGVANAFGLCDMHGNVWEWCADDWHDNYRGAPSDGSIWLTKDRKASKVRRGGAWSRSPRNARSADRGKDYPGIRNPSFGFRVVCLAP